MIKVKILGADPVKFKFKNVQYSVPGICGEPISIKLENTAEFVSLLDAINDQVCQVIVATDIDGADYYLTIYNGYLE